MLEISARSLRACMLLFISWLGGFYLFNAFHRKPRLFVIYFPMQNVYFPTQMIFMLHKVLYINM